MKTNEYQELCKRTIPVIDNSLIINAALGLSGESGEVADHVKKHLFQGHEFDKNEIIKELGDISWYVAAMAIAINVNLEDVFKANIEKLKKRYPNGFSIEASINRTE